MKVSGLREGHRPRKDGGMGLPSQRDDAMLHQSQRKDSSLLLSRV